jgi:hypothetical protein
MEDLPENLEWCESKINEWMQCPSVLLDAQRISSRVAVVHRLTVGARGAEHRFYLKLHPVAESVEDLRERFSHLVAISQVFRDNPCLLPYRVVASDPERRLSLIAETQGVPLLRLRRGVLTDRRVRRQCLSVWRDV